MENKKSPNKKKDELFKNVSKLVVYFNDGQQTVYEKNNENSLLSINITEYDSSNNNFVEMVFSNYKDSASVEELKERCGYSSTKTFTRHFMKYLKMTPKQWMLTEKKKEVIHYLKNTKYPISVIAKKLGFSSSSHLNHFCTDKLGLSPGKIRTSRK